MRKSFKQTEGSLKLVQIVDRDLTAQSEVLVA